jgi:ribulose-5-phosphate 4-epimerase/fuculose-1-phosphate aldolase
METMTPEKAMHILKEHGTIVTLEEAKLIIEFLKKLAEISVRTCLNEENKLENKDE